MTNIRNLLVDMNPWWKGDFKIEFRERTVYKQIQKFIKTPQIIAFTGLRRVGKTTMMFKLIKDAINTGLDPKNIIYISFDELKKMEIRDIITEYTTLMGKNLQEGKYLFLFDEVQKIEGWENQIKGIYDMHKKNVKIIISGSESLFIRKKSKETLAGRIFEFKVEPLSFKEFLIFKGKKFNQINLYERELLKLFEEFILIQGFPELINVKEKAIIKKYIRESIIEKVIYSDLLRLFKIKEIGVLESIVNIIMGSPGQIIELSSLSKEQDISRQTLSTYLGYVEDSFIIKKLYNFSRNQRKIERKFKKYYPRVISPTLLFQSDNFSKSKVFECVIVNQLDAKFFWRDSYKHEVDIVLSNKKIIPIEVKYGKIETEGLLVFMKKFSLNEGYIISYNKEETRKIDGKTIYIIPGFKFLLNDKLTDFNIV